MGDSYSSGEGNPTYDPETAGTCDRSQAAYGRQFATNTASIGGNSIQHIACSGATIANLTTTSLNGEQPQISQIYTGSKLVTLTYPQIFQPRSSCLGNAFLPVPDDQFLISVGLYLDNTIITAAKAAGINVLDERYAFLGHQICSANGSLVYGLTSALTPGEQFLDTSALFHPTAAGQAVLAADLGAYWTALQAGGAPTVWPQTLNQNPSNGWLPRNLPDGIPTNAQAQAMLNSLPTIANPPTPANDGYNSGAPFGTWPGPRNGWTTRNTVLAAQALTTTQGAPANAVVGNGNIVVSGTWQQPYDTTLGAPNTPVQFTYASPSAIGSALPVDHFVPTANAWITGADTWPDYSTAITVTQDSTARKTGFRRTKECTAPTRRCGSRSNGSGTWR
jgi:hypothetical protein